MWVRHPDSSGAVSVKVCAGAAGMGVCHTHCDCHSWGVGLGWNAVWVRGWLCVLELGHVCMSDLGGVWYRFVIPCNLQHANFQHQ